MAGCRGMTVWHLTVDSENRREAWEKHFFPRVHLYEAALAEMRSGGLQGTARGMVRIFSDKALNIAVGDKAMMGEAATPAPPKDAYTMTEVADNRRGSRRMRHWRLALR